MRHPRTPWYVKALAPVVVGIAFSSIDLIPDAIAVLGYLDDLILSPLRIWLIVRLIPYGAWQACAAKVCPPRAYGLTAACMRSKIPLL